MVENNMPQSAELSSPRPIALLFAIINSHVHFHKKLHQAWFASKNHSLIIYFACEMNIIEPLVCMVTEP